MSDPVAELRAAVEDAAAGLRDGAEPDGARRRRSSARPRRSSATTRPTPRCCWRPTWASSRGRSPSGSPRSSRGSLGDGARAGRGRRPRVPQPLPLRRLVPGRGRRAARRRARSSGGRRPRPSPRAVLVEFVSANPTGPADRGRRPSRGLRGLGRPAARVRRAPGRARVLRQRPRRPDRALRGFDRGPDERGAGPRGRLRGRLRQRARRASSSGEGIDAGDPERSARRGAELMRGRDRGDAEALRRRSSTPGPRSASCTSRGRFEKVLADLRERGPRLRERGRDLAAHDRASATTRTGS